MIYDFSLQLHVSFNPQNKPVDCFRASDISRKKKQNFAGFSRANSRKNRPISWDFHGKKVKIRGKIGRSRGRRVKIRRKIGRSRGRRVKIRRKIGRFRGILAEKSQISKDFQGQILRKFGRFHGKFRGETSPRNNQLKTADFAGFSWANFGKVDQFCVDMTSVV